MERVSVDVLITFYNQDKYVNKTIASVLNQRGNYDMHILIGDDGSTDNTITLIEKWTNQYPDKIKLFRMNREEKSYVPGFRSSQNRLNLLKQVESDYFIFLDGDDYFDDAYKLQLQLNMLEAENNQDCTACGHAIDAIHNDGSRKPYARMQKEECKLSLKEYWCAGYVHTDTLLIRSKTIDKYPFQLIENNYNDNLITFLALQEGNLYYIPRTMAVYRQTGDGIWTGSTKIIKNLRNMFLYDLAMQINPDLKRETQKRFVGTWKDLFHDRKKIFKDQLFLYYKEAVEKNLIYARCWMEYRNARKTQRIKILACFAEVLMNSYILGLRNRVTRLF